MKLFPLSYLKLQGKQAPQEGFLPNGYKYDISDSEIAFIEKVVRPMDLIGTPDDE